MRYAPPADRVERHGQPLGIAWMLFGAYRFVAGAVALLALHTWMRSGLFGGMPPIAAQLFGSLLPVVETLLAVSSVLSIVTGWALLVRRPWARTLAIVASILALLKLPFGTALGVYTLWVLGPRASADEWNRHAAQTV